MDIFITALLLLFAILILFWQSSNLISVYFGSPYVSAKTNLVKKALELAKVKPNENFYELGSGSGQVLISAQRLGANCTGIEISPIYFFMKYTQKWSGGIGLLFYSLLFSFIAGTRARLLRLELMSGRVRLL